MSTPVPAGRGRWRLTLLNRQYADGTYPQYAVADLPAARGRRLEQNRNQPAALTFSLDGHRPEAALVRELTCDVIAWRWDDNSGRDMPMFRGVVTQSEDQVTEDANTVTFTCHDYLAALTRRYLTTAYTVTGRDQDWIVTDLVARATAPTASDGTALTPGGYLPLAAAYFNPDGTGRSVASSGQPRDRTYAASQEVAAAVDNLANVINGFEYDVLPAAHPNAWPNTKDMLRIFYPAQGVTRTDVAFVYGSTVAALTRAVNSADYANYTRSIGNNGSSDPAAAQRFAEYWNSDALSGAAGSVGLWMLTDDAADVTVQATLTDKVKGDVGYYGTLIPSYTLTLRPGWYTYGAPNMGDTVALVVKSGRLNVNTTVRVVGIVYDISDDDDETVTVTVGRPAVTLYQLLTGSNRQIDALTRR